MRILFWLQIDIYDSTGWVRINVMHKIPVLPAFQLYPLQYTYTIYPVYSTLYTLPVYTLHCILLPSLFATLYTLFSIRRLFCFDCNSNHTEKSNSVLCKLQFVTWCLTLRHLNCISFDTLLFFISFSTVRILTDD